MCNYQLLCHVDPCHVSARANKLTEGVAVSAGAAAEVQHSAALELCWERKTTAEEPGEKDRRRQQRRVTTKLVFDEGQHKGIKRDRSALSRMTTR